MVTCCVAHMGCMQVQKAAAAAAAADESAAVARRGEFFKTDNNRLRKEAVDLEVALQK